MKFQVCFDFIPFLILKIAIKCSGGIFKKLLNETIYLYDNSWKHFS